MKKKLSLIKLILLLICALTASIVLSSCGESPDSNKNAINEILTEASAKQYTAEIMPIADKFYSIYNRCSLSADSSVSVTDANGFAYSPVESIYTTLDALKQDTEKYFTQEYLENSFYLNLTAEKAFYKDIDGKLYKNTDAISDGKNIWDTASCVISDLSETGFTATVPYLDLYEASRSAKIEFVLDDGTYKINYWVMNL
ncbi:MAG: hypothetical protein ACI4JI_02855 [Ruminiclostridium sp.]